VLLAKRVMALVPMMTKTRTRKSPGGNASGVVPSVTLPLLLLGEEARGLRFPPANPLPKIRTMMRRTLTSVAKDEGRELSVIFYWPRVVLEACPGALVVPLSTLTGMDEATLPTLHPFTRHLM
jgi:hypothetical protein